MRPLAIALIVLVLSGCASRAGPRTPGAAEREWASGASQLLIGLNDALARVADAGVGQLTLANTSNLYEALLGYTYLGGCRHLLEQLGDPPPRQREPGDLLRRACSHLVHASNVFTRAVQLRKASLLVAAAGEALGARSLLRRAQEELGGPAAFAR